MFKKILPLTLAAVCLAFPAVAALNIGEAAPEIQAMDIHGQDFKLSDYKGKTVVLEWTNAECPFVVKHYETGNMQKLQKEATAMEDVVWVSINSSAEGKQGYVNAEAAKALVEAEGAAPSTMLLDPSGEIGKAYGAKTTPHMYVIDENGNLAYMGAIDDNSSPKHDTVEGANNYVMAALSSLKAGQSVAEAVTQPYGCSVKY